MTPLEVPELKQLVSEFWLPVTDSQGPVVTSQGHRILLAMDGCQMEDLSSKEAFDDFERFFMSYPEVFSRELRKIILETATAIASVFPSRTTPASRDRLVVLRDLLYPSHYMAM